MGGLYQLDKSLARVLPVWFRGKEANAHGCLPEAPSSFPVIVAACSHIAACGFTPLI
jgi:hypothetical protein